MFCLQMSQVKTDQSLVRLYESISLLERQMEEGRRAVEQVLHAEITSRSLYTIIAKMVGTTFHFLVCSEVCRTTGIQPPLPPGEMLCGNVSFEV